MKSIPEDLTTLVSGSTLSHKTNNNTYKYIPISGPLISQRHGNVTETSGSSLFAAAILAEKRKLMDVCEI